MKKATNLLVVLTLCLCLGACAPLTPNPAAAQTILEDPAALEQLYNDYFQPVFLSSITAASWTDPEELRPLQFVNYYTAAQYYGLEQQQQGSPELGTVSSRELEDFVLSHFDVSPAFLRTAEAYDKEKDGYVLAYLGGAASSKIVRATQAGDLLTMDFEYYSPADELTVIRSGSLEMQLTEDTYRYLSCASQAVEK